MQDTESSLQLASDMRTVMSRLVKKLRSKTDTGVKFSLTERSTMALLDHHKELLPNELASMEKITTQSMSQVLNHLSELGLITRRISPTDKRKAIISLSKQGQKMLNQLRQERDEWLEHALAETCSAKELEVLRRALVPLTKLVDFD